MFKTFVRRFILLGAGLLWIGLAEAQCPPGMYPFQFSPNQPFSCAPIPGEVNQQAPQLPAEQWERRWGALATSVPDGVLGVSTDQSSKREALRRAVSDCAAKGGVNCKIEISYDNQCAVVVVGDGGYNASNATTVDKAAELSMKTCRDAGRTNCHVYYSACSLPIRIR